jgi:hypothetical protein
VNMDKQAMLFAITRAQELSRRGYYTTFSIDARLVDMDIKNDPLSYFNFGYNHKSILFVRMKYIMARSRNNLFSSVTFAYFILPGHCLPGASKHRRCRLNPNVSDFVLVSVI